ncbi:MAG: hypothetical protein ABI866_06365 [Dokdonella sp.]
MIPLNSVYAAIPDSEVKPDYYLGTHIPTANAFSEMCSRKFRSNAGKWLLELAS